METLAKQTANATCPNCGNASKRFGKHRNGLQRFRCLSCRKTFTEDHEGGWRVEDYLKDRRGLMAIRMLNRMVHLRRTLSWFVVHETCRLVLPPVYQRFLRTR